MRGGRNVLVVLLDNGRAPELRRALARRGEDQHVHVVAPAMVGRLQSLTSDEDAAREQPRDRASGVVPALANTSEMEIEIEQGDADQCRQSRMRCASSAPTRS